VVDKKLDCLLAGASNVLRTFDAPAITALNMDLAKALILSLGDFAEPVISRYQVGLIVHELYARKTYRGEMLQRIQKDFADLPEFNRRMRELEAGGILAPYAGFGSAVYSLLGRKEALPEEVACSVDPFCYLSHLSAMAHHGLTNRIPTKLFISSPTTQPWKDYAHERMLKDLNEDLDTYCENEMPLLTRIRMDRIGKTEVHRFSSIHLGAYKNVRDKTLRVSTMGRTFLDMLRSPELCGGIHHVLEVYEESAKTYQRLIVDEIDRHGAPIDKVRAGYILSEKLQIQDDVVESWVKFAQRGGSRKLDAAGEYIAEWSDKWCLSLNV
jgi:hypothetical protein